MMSIYLSQGFLPTATLLNPQIYKLSFFYCVFFTACFLLRVSNGFAVFVTVCLLLRVSNGFAVFVTACLLLRVGNGFAVFVTTCLLLRVFYCVLTAEGLQT